MTPLKRRILITVGVIATLIVLVIVFISPITKYLIEKYDEKYTGRQVTMDLAYVNPFTGYLHFRNLKIYEYKSDSIFFATKGFSVSLSLIKLIKNKTEISSIDLNEPYILISQTKDKSNFDDLILKFAPDTTDTTAKPAEFLIKKVQITNGEFHYRDNVLPINYYIKKFNLSTQPIKSSSDTINGEFDFESGPGSGFIEGDFMVNTVLERYRTAIKVKKFDLNIIEQYLNGLTNYGTFKAMLDADITTSGSYVITDDFTLAGMIKINDFHFGKTPKEDYASFDQLHVQMKEVSPRKLIFHGDSVILKRPFFRYEQYDYLDNIQRVFGVNGSNVVAAQADPAQFNLILEIADFVKQLSDYFFKSHYKMNRFAIYNADIRYNDYSISEKFAIDFNPLTIIADSIDKSNDWVRLDVKSEIKPYGNFNANITFNPKDSSDFDMTYKVQNVSLPSFNPYLITFSSFPFDRGRVELQGNWNVRNSQIESRNNLLIIDPRLTKRHKNKDLSWLPLRPVMFLIREQGNVIDYEIPIKGDLKSPTFKITDIIFDILKNIFVKPVRTGYRMKVKHVERDIEKSLSLKWPLRQTTLIEDQEKFIERIAEFLDDNKEAVISVHPQNYKAKEKEYILFFETKKKYYMAKNNISKADFSEDDSTAVEKMSVKDSALVRFLNKNINDSLRFTIQEKCLLYTGSEIVERKYDQLNDARIKLFKSFFKEEILKSRVKFSEGNAVVPFNGFSFYRLSYSGDIPKSLQKAYNKMEDLNEENPRKKFRDERSENIAAPEINPNLKRK